MFPRIYLLYLRGTQSWYLEYLRHAFTARLTWLLWLRTSLNSRPLEMIDYLVALKVSSHLFSPVVSKICSQSYDDRVRALTYRRLLSGKYGSFRGRYSISLKFVLLLWVTPSSRWCNGLHIDLMSLTTLISKRKFVFTELLQYKCNYWLLTRKFLIASGHPLE